MSIKVPTAFTSDCDSCESLCCVAVSRNVVDGYINSDCEPGEACPNLNTTCLETGCKIYGVLDQLGWEACTKFDCYGAGPVVKASFDRIGVSWRDANKVDRESLFAFFRLTRFVFNVLAKTSDQVSALRLTTKVELGLDRAFKQLLLNPLKDDEEMYETFLMECPHFLLLPEPVVTEDVMPEVLFSVAAE